MNPITDIVSTASTAGTADIGPEAATVRPAAEQILSACRRYIAAQIHRRQAPANRRNIAAVRAAEVATSLDALLAVHVFRIGRKRGVHTGTDAAMIKAAARAIADNWHEAYPDPNSAPVQGLRNLTCTVYEVLIRRQAEDAARNTPLADTEPPQTLPLFAA